MVRAVVGVVSCLTGLTVAVAGARLCWWVGMDTRRTDRRTGPVPVSSSGSKRQLVPHYPPLEPDNAQALPFLPIIG